MPEIVHACGKKLKFPEGSEGKKGKCPNCGGPVEVPRVTAAEAAPPSPSPPGAAPARSGLAPALKLKASDEQKIELDPPPNWDQFQAYLDGKGPSPRGFVVPANLMLATEADEQWKRAEAMGPPSKYKCPGCQKTIHVGDLVCLACGIDFRLGRTVDGEKKLTDAGNQYLKQIPWLKDAPPPEYDGEGDDEPSEAKKKLGARLKKKKRRLR
jgi:hypothetical protein